MTPAVFVVDAGLLAAADVGTELVLDGAEGRHATKVRRLRPGEQVDLVDGTGLRCAGRVSRSDGGKLVVRLTARLVEPVPQPQLIVVQALVKGDAADEAVRTMTEVGVDGIVPWTAARSVVRWDAGRAAAARHRWQQIAREAGKQARRARFPEIAEVATTAEVCRRLRGAALGIVLLETASERVGGVTVPRAGEVVVVVGPEGGFRDDEVDAFRSAGAVFVRLGPTVLRAATAGTVAAGILLSRTDRWHGD